MTLAAFDGDSLYQLVILLLLGGGSLVKKFIERQQAGQEGPGQGEPGEEVTRRHREDILQRLAEFEESEGEFQGDPWSDPSEPSPSHDPRLDDDPVVFAAAAPTPERSIEGPSLEEFSLEGGSFDAGTASGESWEPGERVRESVFKDIDQSVTQDIIEHVEADMSGGVRGEAVITKVPDHRRLRAARGWRDAVIAAEVLGSPVSLRGPAIQPAGLREE